MNWEMVSFACTRSAETHVEQHRPALLPAHPAPAHTRHLAYPSKCAGCCCGPAHSCPARARGDQQSCMSVFFWDLAVFKPPVHVVVARRMLTACYSQPGPHLLIDVHCAGKVGRAGGQGAGNVADVLGDEGVGCMTGGGQGKPGAAMSRSASESMISQTAMGKWGTRMRQFRGDSVVDAKLRPGLYQ